MKKVFTLSAALLFTYSISANADATTSPVNRTHATEVTQQTKTKVTGTVLDQQDMPVIGANIMLKGNKTTGTITNIDGQFTLEVPITSTLVVSYIGYKNQEVKVTGKALTIKLQEDSETLDEVVVTALGIKREEKALGYAVQKVGGDKLATVKTVDVATGLTGKIAGLNVQNSTEFNEAPTLTLRGESPLLVIDGVPYKNMSLRDIAPDDIESIDVLKGATASALYGARGGSGAVMVTTKRGKEEGLNVTVNSSTMFNAGFLKMPEVQTAYSSGNNGKYNDNSSYVWGAKLDAGNEAMQYNPFTHEREMMPLTSKGKNNLKNFSELSFITNNNVSVTQKGKYGSFRTSLTHVYNKGQWPNEKLNKITYTVSGDMKYKKFSSEAGITYNKRFYPNMGGTGYNGSGYLYNLLVWSGSEYDIRDYKNYWKVQDEQSNWWDRGGWYDNPYYMANELIHSSDYDVVNAFINASYEFTPWLKLAVRSGADVYTQQQEWRAPVGSVSGKGDKKGYYATGRSGGYSMNNDAMLMANHKFGDFSVDGFIGGNVYFYQNDNLWSETQGGLVMPGYYSLKATTDPLNSEKTFNKKQTNSLYGKVSFAYKSMAFIDVTGRNDWSSSLPEETRSYFYPAVSGSVVLSEIFSLPKVIDFWKIRGSWTTTKNDVDVYSINDTYKMNINEWDGMTGAYTQNTLRNTLLSPSQSRSYEIGTAFNLFGNRLRVDYAYYNKLKFNNTRDAGLSPTSGFTKTKVNMDEEQVRKGMELTISGDIIKTKEWLWSGTFNWARDRYYYHKIDPVYSTQKPWVAEGERWDWISITDYQRDPAGNIVHGKDGMPLLNPVATIQGYTSPDWIWGFNTSVSYKNFTLNIGLDGRVGGIAYSKTDQAMWNSGSHIDSDNQWRYDEVVNGNKSYVGQGVKLVSGSADWDSNGNITRDNRVFAPNDIQVSYQDYMINTNPYAEGGSKRIQNYFDQTFIKLRDLSITYALPKDICSKIGMKGASVGFVGQNLLMWTKEFRFSDPDKIENVKDGTTYYEDNISSPSIRYVGFNIKLDF